MIGYTADKVIDVLNGEGYHHSVELYVRVARKNYDESVRKLGYRYNYTEERKEELRRKVNEAEDVYLVMIQVLKKMGKQRHYEINKARFEELYTKKMELY